MELKVRFLSFAVFRNLLEDEVIVRLIKHLENPTAENYSAFVSSLYTANDGDLGLYIKDICENDENIYVKIKGAGKVPPKHIEESLIRELNTLQEAANLTRDDLCENIAEKELLPNFISGNTDIIGSFSERVSNIEKYGYGIFAKYSMFYLDKNTVIPVTNPDKISLSDFADYERERKIIIDNTKALLLGKPAANILLSGDAGTGKSSTVKAVGNEFFNEGLRIIEIKKDNLSAISEILDILAENPLKFIIFIDDLSFLKDDNDFNYLKAILEGSVSAKPKNVVVYATSNRRHIIKENFSDRDGDDIHRNETMQEFVSLSERFGIQVSFKKPDKKTYLNIVKHLCVQDGIKISWETLEKEAERFALERGGRSARVARQFVDILLSE